MRFEGPWRDIDDQTSQFAGTALFQSFGDYIDVVPTKKSVLVESVEVGWISL
jgi:hypothetical protein